jgi:apolipoprotein N-acyltransferase
MTRPGRALSALVPLLAGVLVALSLPPFGLWPLALIGAALLVRSLAGASLGRRAACGMLAGVGQFTIGLAWALKFTFIGYLALVVLEAAFFAFACLFVPPGRGRLVAVAGALTLAEWIRQVWPFGGLPLGGIALGQIAGPLAPTARVGGTLLLAGVVFLAGAGLGELAGLLGESGPARRAASRKALAAAGIPLVIVTGAAIWGTFAPDGGTPVGTISAAIVQGGGRRGFSQLQVPPSTVYRAAVRATAGVHAPVDLVLWPEDVVALGQPLEGSPESAQLAAIARRLHTTLVVGATEPVGTSRFRNEILAYSPSGHLVGVFEKVHRVPFGEYVPWRSFFAHLANLQDISRDAIPGTGSGMIATPAGRFAVLVSFEVFFSDRGRSGVRAGGQLILVPTNTSSYSNAQAPAQEIAASRLQAIAQGRDLLQAAPTGYSAVIDNHGTVLAQTRLSERAVIRTVVPLRDGATIYVRLGDAFPVGLALTAAGAGWILALVERRRRQRKG